MNYYKRFMADYAKKTARLTLAQHGAYTLLLDEIYITEDGLPADMGELYRVCRAMSKDEQAAVRFVAEKFFPIHPDGLRHNPRAMQELTESVPKMEAARANGVKGGRPKKEPAEFLNDNPVGFQDDNPLGFQDETQQVARSEPNAKPSHISDKEDKEDKSSSSTSSPDCPHETLIDLFGKHLPAMPQPRKSLWREGKNAPAMRARWRWVMTAEYESGARKGQRMATTPQEGIEWFDRFFAYVSKSDWLTGKTGAWSCDLGWLMGAQNFEKVIQGNYENKAEE